jgi:hypothetical protein
MANRANFGTRLLFPTLKQYNHYRYGQHSERDEARIEQMRSASIGFEATRHNLTSPFREKRGNVLNGSGGF